MIQQPSRSCKVAIFSSQVNANLLRERLMVLASGQPWLEVVDPESVRSSTTGEIVLALCDLGAESVWPWLAQAEHFTARLPLPGPLHQQDALAAAEWCMQLGKCHLERFSLRRLIDRFEDRIKKDSGRIRMADLLQEANVRLQEQSVRDGLTGIPNRQRFEEHFDYLWGSAAGEQVPITLILSDIDCFKTLNDSLGHQEGDRCLQAVAQRLRELVDGDEDLVARFGGEEFAVLLWNTDLVHAGEMAEKLRLAVKDLALPNPQYAAGHVTISLGVACATPSLTSSAEDFLHHADILMYEAKAAGRDCWVYRPLEIPA